MLKNIFSGIIVGVFVAAMSFFFLVRDPVQPTEGFSVKYSSSSIPTAMFLKVIGESIKDTEVKRNIILKNYDNFLTYSEELALVEYRIANDSGRISEKITAHLRSMLFGVIQDKDGIRIIEPDNKTADFLILPNSEAKVWLIMSYAPYTAQEKFLMNGFNIPITKKMKHHTA